MDLSTIPWWIQLILAVLASAGVWQVILFILNRFSFRRGDKADMDQKEVNVSKTKAEINKSEAESQLVTAQALQTKASADDVVIGTAFKVIERLNTECDMTKRHLAKAQEDLQHTQDNLEKTRDSLNQALDTIRDMTIQLSEMRHDLKNEQQKTLLRGEEIKSLKEELRKLQNK